MQKSKTNKTAAWVLLGGGAALLATGILIQTPEANADFNFTGTGLAIAGIAAVLTSIHFFNRAAKAKKAIASISFKNQPLEFAGLERKLMPPSSTHKTIQALKNSSTVFKTIPAVS